MANTYKNIIITPNIGNTSDPKIQFSGGNTTANTDINLFVYPSSNGTLSFEGSAGQLFSITNDLSNSLFAVSDVSGIPSIEVFANGLVTLAPFGGNVVFGNTAELILSPGAGIYANGDIGTAGHVLHSNGTSIYWAADDQGVTSVASGNGITGGTITSTGTLSVVAGTGTVVNVTGVHVNATYIGTLSANNTTYVNGKTEGNLNVNSATTAINANNASYLGTVAAANYGRLDASGTFAVRMTFSGSQNVGTLLNATGSLGGIEVYGGGGTNAAFMTFHRPGAYASYFGIDSDNQFAVGGWSATAALANMKVGSFGVGTAASGTAGEIRATNNITAYYSDKRLKKNIQKIEFALDKVNQISGVTFQSNEEAVKYGYNDKKIQVGVIAQEIEAVLPEVVVPAPFDIGQKDDGTEYSKSGQNYKTVQYEKLVPLLIEAIKDLSSQVDDLREQIKELKN